MNFVMFVIFVSICVQVVKTIINKGFLDAVNGHCQRNCQYSGRLNYNSPLLLARGKDGSRERYESVFKSPSFDGLRHKRLMETTTDDFLAVFKDGKVSTSGSATRRARRLAVQLM